MFQHIKDLVEFDDSRPKTWKLLHDVIQPNTLPMVIVSEKELAALFMRPGDDVNPVLDKIKDTYARMAAAGSNVSQMQHCTKIILQILQEDFRRRHTGGGAANKTAEGYGAAGGSRRRGGGRGRGHGRGFGRGRGRGDYNEGHGSSGGKGSTRMEGACWYCKKARHPWFTCFSRPEAWVPLGMKPPTGERARGGAVQGSEGDVGSIVKVVMHPFTHWVIDSGCTSHMTPREDLLDEVKPPGNIKFVVAASGALLPVIGVGNAKVMGANGGLVGLGNVLLVEGLSANLLSVRRLQKRKAKVTFGRTNCHAKLGKTLLWDLEEMSSCIKDLWQLPIIPSNGKLPATAVAAATAKATTGGEETAPSNGALDAVKKVQQPEQPHGEVLAGVDATAAWAKASSGSGEADWETWHERLCHVNSPMLQKSPLVKNRVLATVGDKQWVPYTKWYGSAPAVNMLRAYGCMVVFHVPKEKRGKLEASGRWRVHLELAKDQKGWLIWDLTSRQLTVSRDVKFLDSLYYKEWKQQQQKLPTTPLIIEADEVQRPLRQVQVTVSNEEISGVTEDGGEPEVEKQQ
ncbi:unnamed protein product [Closterium sp. NIES-53]